MKRTHWLRPLAGAMLIALLLTGCGSDKAVVTANEEADALLQSAF